MSVKEILKETETKMKKCVESAQREFSEVRTGRAHPGLIEGMHVDYFGTATPFKQLASISTPDPRTIMIQPWDPSVIPEMEKAILASNLGVMPSNDGKIVRLSIPQLSDERRRELAKVVKDMAEQSRVSLRTVRHAANDKLKKMQSEKTISEDEHFKSHEEVQKLTDKHIREIDQLLEQKNKSLTEVS
jgi:ribosome recycling factor